ncbi:MAG: Uma2 family endonuclease [Chloroflexi bacterium]|nr:Uma2 family endonuclease [Chloroflexota bacterium]
MDDYTLISRPRALVPPTRPITFDEFLRDFDGHRAEWLPDGKVEILSEESVIAVQLRMDLSELLGVYLAATNWGYLFASFMQRTADNLPVRNADLLILARSNLERIMHSCLNGPANIAIEIVSPESTVRDYGMKFREYELGKVPEYWMFDPDRQNAAIYELSATGVYHCRPTDSQGRLTSGVLHPFAIDPARLWANAPLTNADNLILVAEMLGVPVESLLR